MRYFVNVAEAGMGAATVRAAGRLPRFLGKVRYLVAFWPTLARFHPGEVTVTVNGERFQGRAHTAIIANGRFFGGGMGISPHSNPDDGIADLQINIGPKRQAFTLIPKIYKGTHLPSGLIVQLSGREGLIETARRGRRRNARHHPAPLRDPARDTAAADLNQSRPSPDGAASGAFEDCLHAQVLRERRSLIPVVDDQSPSLDRHPSRPLPVGVLGAIGG